MRCLAFAISLLLSLAAPAGAADFSKDLQAALGPYYAALVASAHGDIDQTQRQMLLFASRWEVVSREAKADAPAALRGDPKWDQFVQQVVRTLDDARERCRRRDAAGAHAQLESVRLTLREIDRRHNLAGVDDYLTDLHDAMQRMVGHVGGPNEIVLRPKDYDDIGEDYQAAEQAWKAVESSAGPLAESPAWHSAALDVSSTLSAIGRQLLARQPSPLVPSIQALRDRYYALLLAVAKARS